MKLLVSTSVKDIKCEKHLHQYYQQLIQLISARTKDPACPAIFARPVENTTTGGIDWYTDLDGDAVCLADSSDADFEQFWEQLDPIDAKIRDLVQRLRGTDRKAVHENADRIEKMLTYPGSMEFMFLVDDRPVIAAWGCASASIMTPVRIENPRAVAVTKDPEPSDAKPEPPSGPVDPETKSVPPLPPHGEPPATAESQEPSKRHRGWIWWLLSLLLLALMCVLLLQRCANQKVIPMETERDQVERMSHAENSLRKEIQGLKERLTNEWAKCPGCADDVAVESERRSKYIGDQPDAMVSVSLIWNTYHDLDLHVFSPTGSRIYFKQRSDANGGRLNKDFNNHKKKNEPLSRDPIENITWPPDKAPEGQYRVQVMLYSVDSRDCHVNPVPFTVVVDVNGRKQTIPGSAAFPADACPGEIKDRKMIDVFSFNVPK